MPDRPVSQNRADVGRSSHHPSQRTTHVGRSTLIGCGAVALSLALLGGGWLVLFVAVYILPAIANRNHQEFARNGVHLIKPAAQLDAMFSDCRHYIIYGGEQSRPVWNAVAYFGDRYQLTMQVPVRIESKTEGEVAGPPEFFLIEVYSVRLRPDGTVDGASIGKDYRFDEAQWQKVVASGGDFGAIGINLNPAPVPNFRRYAASRRGG